MKTIRSFDLKNKKVIIRVDFNVPISNNLITDDTRIKEALETINYAINNEAKVILMSHLGRVKKESDKQSLEIVGKRLSELLNKEVIFVNNTRGAILENSINKLNNKDVLLMENTRYEDLKDEAESKNSEGLGKYWASLGDIFINDAFGTIHRAHASNVGIAKYLNSGVGFLVEREMNNIGKIIENPKRPFTVVLGGAKVEDKIGVVKNLVTKADYILIGGGMAFTFLKASGIQVGDSIVDENNIQFCKDIINNYSDKVILPIDVITNNKECFINEMTESDQGLDIGYKTVRLFKQYLENSKTIILNGPMGKFEEEKYSNGTKNILQIISETDAVKIAGGGDTVSAIKKYKLDDKFTHISTGGGATLELLEGTYLPGIKAIEAKE